MSSLLRSKGPVVAVLLLALVACKRGSSSEQTSTSSTSTPANGAATGIGVTPPASELKNGDRIQVRWKGTCYGARILKVAPGPSYFITYEGYDHSWDETITPARICK